MKKTTVILRRRYLKEEKRKKKLRICAMLFVAVISVTVLVSVFTADASDETGRIKYYTSIELSAGDSLWSVADRYMTEEYAGRDAFIRELCKLNHLRRDDLIHEGQHLVVPYYTDVKY